MNMRHNPKSMKKQLTLALALLLGSATAATAPQVAWLKNLKVLGSISIAENGDLVYIGTDARAHRTDANGKEKWNFALGDVGRAQPIITPAGKVIIGAYDDYLIQLNAAGQVDWRVKLDGDIVASPALRADGSVLAASSSGTLWALSSTGQPLWSFKAGGGIYSSPTVAADGTIYFGAQDNQLYALTPAGGRKWAFRANSFIFSSPAVDAQGNVYFGSSDRNIYAVDANGQLRWRVPANLFVNASPIITSTGLIVVGSYDGNVYAIDKNGAVEWTYKTGAPVAAPAVELTNGDVLVGDLQGTLHAINASGRGQWTIKTGKRIDTTVAVSDAGTWYFSTNDGQLSAIQRQAPIATGEWSFYRSVPSGWGRTLTATEATNRRSRTQAAQAAARPTTPAPTPTTPAPRPTPGGTATTPAPRPTTPTPAVDPVAAATRAGRAALVRDGQVYLPLTDLVEALGARVRVTTSVTTTLEFAGRPVTLTVRSIDGRAYVPLAALTLLPDAAPAYDARARAYRLRVPGRTVSLPLDFARLLRPVYTPR
ncbi:Pyrrolo-quinoline quinone repeat-containing protein [Deinococcus maricopensis DSM 21211]|uniref:Pyrrolo-quinoline quinone repeat-containing protein n=2 Tax=Deinococcus TaxID=1298 RepID=E8U874_DEIML|nr:Pyrrolo-quinoline quinone repeat-containing protein [Deinococcus maricopensis DSM 21211]